MTKYHINKNGNPAICKASVKCPLGDNSKHYNTAKEAREAFEGSMSNKFFKIHTARQGESEAIDSEKLKDIENVEDEDEALNDRKRELIEKQRDIFNERLDLSHNKKTLLQDDSKLTDKKELKNIENSERVLKSEYERTGDTLRRLRIEAYMKKEIETNGRSRLQEKFDEEGHRIFDERFALSREKKRLLNEPESNKNTLRMNEIDRNEAVLRLREGEVSYELQRINIENVYDVELKKNYYSDPIRIGGAIDGLGRNKPAIHHDSIEVGSLNPIVRVRTSGGAVRSGENSIIILGKLNGKEVRAVGGNGEIYESPAGELGRSVTHSGDEGDLKLRVLGYVNCHGGRYGWIPNEKIPLYFQS